MNKILLSFGSAMFALTAFAQSNSENAGNMASDDNKGYVFEYKKTENTQYPSVSINCLDAENIHSGAGTFTYDDAAEAAVYKTDGTTGAIKVLFTTGNCANTIGLRETNDGIDVSAAAAQKITIELNPDSALRK